MATRDDINWTFTLNADGTSKLEAVEGTKKVEYKAGTWEVYGYYMVMNFNTLLNPGSTTSMYGQLQTGTVDRETGVLSPLIKSPYKTYFLNIPYFMRVRKRLDAEKIRKIG